MTIKTVGFDADDTLWHNEHSFRKAESRFAELLGTCGEQQTIKDALFSTIKRNLALYGYGFKSMTLSMIETASNLHGNGVLSSSLIMDILALGRAMMEHPVTPIAGVAHVLAQLKESYRLILISKGDWSNRNESWQNPVLPNFLLQKKLSATKIRPFTRKF